VRDLAREADLVLVLGSQNSSNSRRLAEIARSLEIPSFLIDGVAEIQDDWFRDVDTVLITAGASAPEDVVQECVEYLQRNFGATIQEEFVRRENVHFPLPKSLRELLPPGSVVSPGAVVNAGARTEPIENTWSVGQVD
jgi:4-hydroxy-3-methylbut-2-enyl diphosphate reductase